jgi:hypothetical protein
MLKRIKERLNRHKDTSMPTLLPEQPVDDQVMSDEHAGGSAVAWPFDGDTTNVLINPQHAFKYLMDNLGGVLFMTFT